MAKRPKNDEAPRILIRTGDEAPEENDTFLALLRDQEKIPPIGGQGTLVDRLGGVFQEFMARQMAAAGAKRAAVKGKVTLTFAFVTGPDGSHGVTCEEAVKVAKMPARPSVIFTDETGDMLSRPAATEPLIEEMHRRDNAAKPTAPVATEPKVGTSSNL